ncbi:MAG: hypothetical protein RSE25_09425 [Bacteroidales bacterium]
MNKKELELLEKAIKDKGEILMNAEDYHYGDFIIPFAAEFLGITVERQICRVVQIRKEIGQFGSDKFFVRHADGSLLVWENQHFYKVKEEYTSQIETLYNQHDAIEIDDDKPDVGYRDIGEKDFILGFIVPSPYSADHVTPMKAVQAGIKEKIREIINS